MIVIKLFVSKAEMVHQFLTNGSTCFVYKKVVSPLDSGTVSFTKSIMQNIGDISFETVLRVGKYVVLRNRFK